MSDALHPKDGARLLLVWRATEADGSASYAASVFTPTERYDYDATLDMSGTADLVPTGSKAPEDLETKLANLAKSTARAAKRKQEADLPPWPRRVLRWRGPGRG